MNALVLSLLLQQAAVADVGAVSVDVAGEVVDLDEGDGVVVVSTSARKLFSIDERSKKATALPPVPTNAVAYDVCGAGVVFVDDHGVIDDKGHRLIARAPLLAVADPMALLTAEVCAGAANERMLVVKDGIVVVVVDKDGNVVGETLLPFVARARAYSARWPKSLRGERGYGQALSLYAPRIFSVDVDDDKDADLVVLHEGRLAIFRRGAAGLSTTPEERDLYALANTGGSADLRVRFAGSRVVVSASNGAVPEQSKVVVIDGTADKPYARVKESKSYDGLALLLGVVDGKPVVAQIDTSLVALSGVVLTGKVGIKVKTGDDVKASLTAAADIRAGKMDGALATVDVDVDGDGHADLVDLGEVGAAVVYAGSSDRAGALAFVEAKRLTVPRFALVAPLSSSVALVSQPTKQKARLTFIGR